MKFTLNKRKLKDDRICFSIEYYRGSEISAEGKRRHLRSFENLDRYLFSDPVNPAEKKHNKQSLEIAENVLSIRKSEFLQGKFNLKNTTKSKRTFLNYFTEEKQQQDSSNNYGNWFSTHQHLKKVISKNLTFDEVDENFINQIHKYFENYARTESDLPLSQNSKYSYFYKFKDAHRNAFEEGYHTINYASKIKSFLQAESQREYLTFDELQSLAKAECKYPILKKAFLFSCLANI
ncbi:phage integrase SAM-like domain-containing protein [Chryseobacterium sp. A301]